MQIPIEHLIVYGISIVVIITIICCALWIIHRGGLSRGFFEMIKDKNYRPSLSLFQFFLWTLVISFGFLSIYFIRIIEGAYDSPILGELPVSILVLMGISTAVPVIRQRMTSNMPPIVPTLKKSEQKSALQEFSSILQETGKPTLPRFQMFIWTFIGIIIYLTILFSSVNDLTNTPIDELENQCKDNRYDCLRFPDIDPSLIVLMGLSQGAYLGGEFYTHRQKDHKIILSNAENDGIIDKEAHDKLEERFEE